MRIVQYPAHVALCRANGKVRARALCVDGTSIRAATEICLEIAQHGGAARVEIYRVDGTVFETGVPV